MSRLAHAWQASWRWVKPILVIPTGPEARRVASVWLAMAGMVYILGLPTDTRRHLVLLGPETTGWLMTIVGVAAYITATYGRLQVAGRVIAILGCLISFEVTYNLLFHAWVGVASYSWMCVVFVAQAVSRRHDGY